MRMPLHNVKLAAISLSIFLGPMGWADAETEVTVSTDLGEFVIELYAEDAPLHVANFLQYVDQGFYVDTVFHRVMGDFMIQVGGYDRQLAKKDTNSPVMNESENGLSNVRGSVAAARLSDPHSADSQFYINLVDNPSLDGSRKKLGYTVFGHVTSGMEIVDAIAELPTGAAGRFKDNVPSPLVGVTTIRREPLLASSMFVTNAALAQNSDLLSEHEKLPSLIRSTESYVSADTKENAILTAWNYHEHYLKRVGKMKLNDLLNDGWNWQSPLQGLPGIVGFTQLYSDGKLQEAAFLGLFATNVSSDMREKMLDLTLYSFERALDPNDKIPNHIEVPRGLNVFILFSVTFENGELIRVVKFNQKLAD